MLFTNTLIGLVAVAVATVQADPIKVTVGADGKLAFNPNNVNAAVGQQVEFSFFPKNHSIIQSSFGKPCVPLSTGGFFSGFQPTKNSPSGTTFTVTVQDTKPIWFYCGQTTGNHCQMGMAGSINAPTTGNTIDAFIALAKNATIPSISPPGGPVGGVLFVPSNGSSTTTTSASTTSSTTSVTTIAEATSAIISTYTSANSVYTATVGSSTSYSTVSTVVAAAPSPGTPTGTGAPVTITGAASAMSANLFAAGAVVFGAMAMI